MTTGRMVGLPSQQPFSISGGCQKQSGNLFCTSCRIPPVHPGASAWQFPQLKGKLYTKWTTASAEWISTSPPGVNSQPNSSLVTNDCWTSAFNHCESSNTSVVHRGVFTFVISFRLRNAVVILLLCQWQCLLPIFPMLVSSTQSLPARNEKLWREPVYFITKKESPRDLCDNPVRPPIRTIFGCSNLNMFLVKSKLVLFHVTCLLLACNLLMTFRLLLLKSLVLLNISERLLVESC